MAQSTEVVLRREPHGGKQLDWHEPADNCNPSARVHAAVERPRLEDWVAGRRGVHVRQHVVVCLGM